MRAIARVMERLELGPDDLLARIEAGFGRVTVGPGRASLAGRA